jgi:hypothetical protein
VTHGHHQPKMPPRAPPNKPSVMSARSSGSRRRTGPEAHQRALSLVR